MRYHVCARPLAHRINSYHRVHRAQQQKRRALGIRTAPISRTTARCVRAYQVNKQSCMTISITSKSQSPNIKILGRANPPPHTGQVGKSDNNKHCLHRSQVQSPSPATQPSVRIDSCTVSSELNHGIRPHADRSRLLKLTVNVASEVP